MQAKCAAILEKETQTNLIPNYNSLYYYDHYYLVHYYLIHYYLVH
jgi:hypothetical protein